MDYNELENREHKRKDQKMDNALSDIISGLTDVGFGATDVEKAEKLFRTGRSEELILYLRQCRCDLLEQLHASRKRVDRIDYLIRRTGKAMNES